MAMLEVVCRKCVSHGVFSVKEILEKNSDILDMYVPKNGIEIYRDKADEVVAEKSTTRDEFFQGDKEISYMIIEVQDDEKKTNNEEKPEIKKVIPRNFGHIEHLKGSKMIDAEDKMLPMDVQEIFTVKKRDKSDIVIVTEKVDGMNAGVVKKNGKLIPINRKGYPVSIMGQVRKELSLLGKCWETWVNLHSEIYNDILMEGERLVFENCIIKHTLSYKFHTDPVFLLAKYNEDGSRVSYSELRRIGEEYGLAMPPLLNYGCAIAPEAVLFQYPNGLVGSRNKIEGIVYVYEHNGKFDGSAKFVSNKLMGTNPSLSEFNKWNGRDEFMVQLNEHIQKMEK